MWSRGSLVSIVLSVTPLMDPVWLLTWMVSDAGGPETSLLTDRWMAMDVTRNLHSRVHDGQRRF